MTRKDMTALLVLASIWGGSFLFIRIASPAFGPIMLMAGRLVMAALALLAYGAATRGLPPLKEHWREYLFLGVVNSAVPFVLIAFAALQLPASLTATLNATTPLFGALVSAAWLGDQISVRKAFGLALGTVGVATLVGFGPLPLTPSVLLAAGCSLAAAACYGLSAAYTKARLQGVSSLAITTYSQVFAALVLLPVAPFVWPSRMPSGLAFACMVTLALLCTGVAYMLYFGLIARVGPTKTTMVTYLSPVFGTLWGVLLLHESLGIGSLIGFALVLTSVAFVTGSTAARKQAKPRTAEGV